MHFPKVKPTVRLPLKLVAPDPPASNPLALTNVYTDSGVRLFPNHTDKKRK